MREGLTVQEVIDALMKVEDKQRVVKAAEGSYRARDYKNTNAVLEVNISTNSEFVRMYTLA